MLAAILSLAPILWSVPSAEESVHTLEKPIVIPAGEEVFFDCVASTELSGLFRADVEDAAGKRYEFYTVSFGNLNETRGRPWTSRCLRNGAFNEVGTVRVRLLKPEKTDPVPPLKLVGFRFRPNRAPPPGGHVFRLSDFRVGKADFRTEDFYYAFKDGERFGSMDGNPRLYMTDLLVRMVTGPRHELEWSLRDRHDGQPLTNGVVRAETPGADPRPYKFRVDAFAEIPRMPAGTYWVKATLRSNWREGRGYTSERTLDFRYDVFRNGAGPKRVQPYPPMPAEPASEPLAKLPAGVPSAQEILEGPEPLAMYYPHLSDKANIVPHFRHLFGEMAKAGNVRTVEVPNRWQDCERESGVFDFSDVLQVLDDAQAKGIRCIVSLELLIPPEWMPSIFTMNREGAVFGHTRYLFHGARINLFFSPYVRKRALAYVRALVRATRDHPALLGYYYITEHPFEAGWAGWYEGFDPDTIAAFRKAMKRRYGAIGKANAKWGTSFRAFETLEPPAVKEEAPNAYRRDWLNFRRRVVHGFIVKCVDEIRALDPHRLIEVYGDGLCDAWLGDLAGKGCIIANGGGPQWAERCVNYSLFTELGMPQRTETITVETWADHPYQLERSLFCATYGGGAASYIKAFPRQDADFESLRRDPYALDRFEAMLPVWKELRTAKPCYGDIRLWAGGEGDMTEKRQPAGGGGGTAVSDYLSRDFLKTHLLAGMCGVPGWERTTKLAVLLPRTGLLTEEEVEQLAAFVRGGGTVAMADSVGKTVIGHENDPDWFRRRLGAERVHSYKEGPFPHLRELARSAGCALPLDADSPQVMLSLLRKGDVFYLFAATQPGAAVPGTTITFDPPDRAFARKEIRTSLERDQVRLWRITAKGAEEVKITLRPYGEKK